MTQTAPDPAELRDLVDQLRYRLHLGWLVWLEDDFQRDKPGRHAGESRGMTLVVQRAGPNSYHPVNIKVRARELLDALAKEQPVTELAAQLSDALDALLPVNHYFAVPPATYNRPSWMRWLFDRLADVDTHERMEDFAFATAAVAQRGTGQHNADEAEVLVRPLAPCHGPGWDPYVVTYERADLDRRTSFRGVLDDDGTGRARVSEPEQGSRM